MARRLNYFVPQGLRWITQPIFGYIFDKKILNLDTEHLKQVPGCCAVCRVSYDVFCACILRVTVCIRACIQRVCCVFTE
jgi:hypothetical protein